MWYFREQDPRQAASWPKPKPKPPFLGPPTPAALDPAAHRSNISTGFPVDSELAGLLFLAINRGTAPARLLEAAWRRHSLRPFGTLNQKASRIALLRGGARTQRTHSPAGQWVGRACSTSSPISVLGLSGLPTAGKRANLWISGDLGGGPTTGPRPLSNGVNTWSVKRFLLLGSQAKPQWWTGPAAHPLP